MIKDKPFKITIESYDKKVSVEVPTSDVTFNEYMDMLRSITSSIYSVELWDDYFTE